MSWKPVAAAEKVGAGSKKWVEGLTLAMPAGETVAVSCTRESSLVSGAILSKDDVPGDSVTWDEDTRKPCRVATTATDTSGLTTMLP